MTSEHERARDEQMIAAITVVLTAGHTVEDAEGELRIFGTPGAQFVVTNAHAEPDAIVHEEFDDVRAAVGYYLDFCDGLSKPH